MNSSGIKRGLAATAVAALAVTGLPFLASSASAAPNGTLSVLSQAPIRNTNAAGGAIVVKSSQDGLTAANMKVANADYSNPVAIAAGNEISSPAFDLDVISFTQQDPNTDNDNDIATGSAKFADGTYHYAVQTAVTLGSATKATFGLVEDAAPTGGPVNASDPKTVIEVTPTGAPAAVDISTTQNPTAAGVPTPFTVTVKDAAGNLTQLIAGEQINVAGADVISDAALNSTDLAKGTVSIDATWLTGGSKTITATGNGTGATPATLTDSASETVIDQATITTDEFKFDTGADTWKDGTTAFGTATQVRVDQNSVTFSFASKDSVGEVPENSDPDDAGKIVLLKLDAPANSAIRFNGKDANAETAGYLVVPVLLGADGKGSTTVALTGATAGATWTFGDVAGSMVATTVTMARAQAASVSPDAGVYVTKVGSPTSVTVTVKDQFGNPIGAPAQVSLTRAAAPNAGTTARQTVDADGKATFSLPDAGTTAGRTESFTINLFTDQFDGTGVDSVPGGAVDPFTGGDITYTADGLGGDFTIGGAITPASTSRTPIYDATATPGTDALAINITGGTANAPVTVSADHGALVLTGTDTTLDKAKASGTVTLGAAGSNILAGNAIHVVGTKAGVVNVTITSGGRTKTVSYTVAQPAAGAARIATARNIAVEAPEKAKAGDVAVFTVHVTDAFGNGVSDVLASSLNFQVSGPANLQSTDAKTDGNGDLKVNVILTDNASSSVSLKVTGVVDNNAPTVTQFGDAVNVVDGAAAPGISASQNTESVTITDVVNIAELQAAVDAAQEKVDQAQDAVDAAQDNLAIAKAERSVAQKAVKQAKKDLKQAKKNHKGVKAARKALREARGDLRIANAKVSATQSAANRADARLAAAQAELEAAQQALEDAQK